MILCYVCQTVLSDVYLTAKVYFDMGEYQRAAHTLEARVSAALQGLRRGAAAGEAAAGATLNQEELFLRCYALYLAGEKVRHTYIDTHRRTHQPEYPSRCVYVYVYVYVCVRARRSACWRAVMPWTAVRSSTSTSR